MAGNTVLWHVSCCSGVLLLPSTVSLCVRLCMAQTRAQQLAYIHYSLSAAIARSVGVRIVLLGVEGGTGNVVSERARQRVFAESCRTYDDLRWRPSVQCSTVQALHGSAPTDWPTD